MKNRWFILILFLLITTNVKALDFCTETEEYKNYINMSPEERVNVVEPIRCEETIEDSKLTTELKSKVINMTNTFVKSSISDSSYRSPYVTSIKNQYEDGTCWGFSAIATVESNYMKNGKGTLDLSEAHLAYTLLGGLYSDAAGKHNKLNYDASGGLITFAPSYFFNYQGELTESEWAYTNPKLPVINSSQYKKGRHIVSVDTFKIENLNANHACTNDEITVIKNAILEHGAVQGTMYSKGSLYREGKYYRATTSDSTSSNHAVTIVGWDDNMSGSKFGASRNGAWIVKNSWGDDLFDNGYFYISYEDNFICQLLATYSGVSDDVYTNSYKAAEMIGTVDRRVDPHTYVATKFTRTKTTPEQIEKVSFATSTMGKYRVYLAKNNNPDDINNWVLIGSGTSSNLGIDSVKVQNQFVSDQEFTIVVEYDNSAMGSSQSILYTCANDDLTSNMDYASGKYYISYDLTNWRDMYSINSTHCAPNVYVYTSDYKDGISEISASDVSYNNETAYITLDRDDSLTVENIQIYNLDNEVTSNFEISYNNETDVITINNINKKSGNYKLKITDNNEEYKIISFTFQNEIKWSNEVKYISKVDDLLYVSVDKDIGLTYENFTQDVTVINSPFKIYNTKGEQVTSGKIETGSRIVLNDNTYYFIIKGDVSGDGIVNSADLMKIVKYLKGNTLTDYQFKAAEVTNDDKINSADLMKIVKFLKGTNTL